jgi:hypothetical protein
MRITNATSPLKAVLAVLVVLLAASTLHASAQENRVSVRDLPTMQQGFTVVGTVVAVKGNTFALDDGTGIVIVDAGPPWWHQLGLTLGEEVTVVALPEFGGLKAVQITRADGAVIEVRPMMGPPPWAGGPFRHGRMVPMEQGR